MPISLCWPIYIFTFYLTSQKSVLNTWLKPIEFSDLLAVQYFASDSYNLDSRFSVYINKYIKQRY